MDFSISAAERECRELFEELIALKIVPEPPRGELFAHVANSLLEPVQLPQDKPMPLPSRESYVALPRHLLVREDPSC